MGLTRSFAAALRSSLRPFQLEHHEEASSLPKCGLEEAGPCHLNNGKNSDETLIKSNWFKNQI